MHTVRLVYDVEGWAYHRNAQDIAKYAPDDFRVSMGAINHPPQLEPALGSEEPDIVLLLPYWMARQTRSLLQQRGWKSKLVVYWNRGWPGMFPSFRLAYRNSDLMIINHMEYWARTGPLQRAVMIPMGVDLDSFKVTVPIDNRKPKVLWLGSKINSGVKGYSDCIDPLRALLAARKIDYDFRLIDSHAKAVFNTGELRDWYNSGIVLVVASDQEGTPNVALEAAACGCTLVSTRVGNMPELIRNGVNGYLVDREPQAVLRAVESSITRYQPLATQMLQDIKAWDWRNQSEPLYQSLRGLRSPPKQNRRLPAKLDLSDQVSVFVTTVGAPTYDGCLQHLREQDCKFQLKIIENTAPMCAAFNRMLEQSDTPYYAQVDEDMLLYPAAIRNLHEMIVNADSDVAFAVGELLDIHLRRWIDGVKIFRRDIARRFPFEDTVGSEVKQLAALRSQGYRIIYGRGGAEGPTELFGLHVVPETPTMYFERYATLAYRRYNGDGDLSWLDVYPEIFLRRVLHANSNLDLFALLGMIAGKDKNLYDGGEKDFRRYRDLLDVEKFKSLLTNLDLDQDYRWQT